MVYAILKLSYNEIGDTSLVGGICGSAFFISKQIALTAHHLLNKLNYSPNFSYNRCQYWLLSKSNDVIPLKVEYLIDCPDIDTTIIRFEDTLPISNILKLSDKPANVGEECFCEGYISEMMPVKNPIWSKDGLIIGNVDLTELASDGKGIVKRILELYIQSHDVNLNGVKSIELSFGGIQGMSGSPLIRKTDGEVIGLMSAGLPVDSRKKNTLYAISVEEIKKKLANLHIV